MRTIGREGPTDTVESLALLKSYKFDLLFIDRILLGKKCFGSFCGMSLVRYCSSNCPVGMLLNFPTYDRIKQTVQNCLTSRETTTLAQVQPVLVPSHWSVEEFERALQSWLDAFSCNDHRNFARCSTPLHDINCGDCGGNDAEGGECCRFVHSSANVSYPVSTPFLQLATIVSRGGGGEGGIEVATTASARSAAMHVRAPGSTTPSTPSHRLALVFFANVRPRRSRPSNSAVAAQVVDAKGLLCADKRSDGESQFNLDYELYEEGGYTLEECISACAAQGVGCSRVNFFRSTGVCHLFATCSTRRSAADGDGVV